MAIQAERKLKLKPTWYWEIKLLSLNFNGGFHACTYILSQHHKSA